MDGIRNQLSHVYTYLCHDGIDQLTLRQGEIRVVVVRMIRTRLPVVVWVKSCPGKHSSCTIASLSGCARKVGRPPISGVAQELIKAN